MITCSPFPLCCGISVLNNFPGLYGAPSKRDLENVEKSINDYINRKSTGVYLISLNGKQKKYYTELMKKLGFEPMIEDFVNPLHNSTVSLYGKAVIGSNVIPEILPQKLPHSIFKSYQDYQVLGM